MTEIWTSSWNAAVAEIEQQAHQAEDAGFDGLFFTDSQNLWLECWVALTVAAKATSRLKVGTAVTNPITRHPAVTADAAATLQEVSDGRVVLGIGRGDSSLAHLGYGPAPLNRFAAYVRKLQQYLRGEDVEFGEQDDALPAVGSLGYANTPTSSKIRWLPGTQPKVPVEVAGAGPKVVRLAADLADGVILGVGADTERLTTLLKFVDAGRAESDLAGEPFSRSAFITVVPHYDQETARRLAAGGVASATRWSVMQSMAPVAGMDAKTRNEFAATRTTYDMVHHGEIGASHTREVSDELIDRIAIVGSPDHCIERLRELMALGLDRIQFNVRVRGADADEQAVVTDLMVNAVLPGIRT